MTANNLQKELFSQIKDSLPSHISMVDAIAELLDISYDSVYRRIRGEKPVSLEEVKILCDHFHLSLDQVLQLHTNKVLFTDVEADNPVTNFRQYLEGLIQLLKYFNGHTKKEMSYLSKDVPVFYFFYFPEIAAFKSFFWCRSILNEPGFEEQRFSIKKFDGQQYFELGQKILKEYNQLPSAELWNYESINSTLLQIEYYRDAGIFESKEDLAAVVDSCDAMLQHLQRQAEKGKKFFPGTNGTGGGSALRFYINEIILGNNNIIVDLDDKKTAFINSTVLKYISTSDKKFTEKMHDNFQNLLSRSVMISQAGERERVKFFNGLRERVQGCKK
jgi:hypothetical protein